MSASSVALFFTVGHSRLLTEMAELANDSKAYTIAISPKGTPLATVCDAGIPLAQDIDLKSGSENQGRYMQLVTIDLLVSTISKRRLKDPENHKRPDFHTTSNY